jgi:hypothetical protein
MSESKATAALNVRLKPSESSTHPSGDERSRLGAAAAADSAGVGRLAYSAAAEAEDMTKGKYLRTHEGGMSTMRLSLIGMVAGGLVLGLVTSSTAGLVKEGTVAERFEKAIDKIKKSCASRKLDPGEVCGEVAKLKPADPLATEEGRFAHSIKIPNPVPADSGYKPGMTPEQYFDHLCKTEAGEFIFKTVENVEGLYMMRPRKEATDYELEHLYALEDPYGQVVGESDLPQDYYVQPAMGKYQFLEMPLSRSSSADEQYRRYYRDENAHPGKKYQAAINGQGVFVPYIVAEATVSDIKSRYSYTWRGINRPHDRELGIAGGEVIILDLQTKEVLAVRRGFIRSGWMKNLTSIWWLTGQVCRGAGAKREHLFLKEILKPVVTSTSGKEK